jgi:hypothetical protein
MGSRRGIDKHQNKGNEECVLQIHINQKKKRNIGL